jgi:hypothetical protein
MVSLHVVQFAKKREKISIIIGVKIRKVQNVFSNLYL